MRHGIESLPRLLRSGESNELGHGFGIAGDDDLALAAQERLASGQRWRRSLTEKVFTIED
jgi:hypothetical protein